MAWTVGIAPPTILSPVIAAPVSAVWRLIPLVMGGSFNPTVRTGSTVSTAGVAWVESVGAPSVSAGSNATATPAAVSWSLTPGAATFSAGTAPIVAAVGATSAGNSVSRSATIPASTNVGDLLIGVFSTRNPGSITSPAGWDVIDDTYSTTNITQLVICGRIAQAGDAGATATWTNVGGIAKACCAVVMRITGTGVTTPDAQAYLNSATSASQAFPTVVTSVTDCLLLYLQSFDNGSISATPPAAVTEVFDFGAGGATTQRLIGGWEAQTSAGASTTRTFTMSAATSCRKATVALAPGQISATAPPATAGWTLTPAVLQAAVGVTVVPDKVSWTLAAPAPLVLAGLVVVNPATVHWTAGVGAPLVGSQSSTVSTATVTWTAGAGSATVSAGSILDPASVAWSMDAGASVSAGFGASPFLGTAAWSWTSDAPVVSTAVTAFPELVPWSMAAGGPGITTATDASPAVSTVGWSGDIAALTVSTASNATLTPATVGWDTTAFAPSIATGVTVTPVTVAWLTAVGTTLAGPFVIRGGKAREVSRSTATAREVLA